MIRCNQIGTEVSQQQFVDYLNSVRGGQFFFIRGYQNSQHELSDHWLRFGISYPNIKARDIIFLNEILEGTKSFNIHVKHGVWSPPERLESLFLSYEAIGALSEKERAELVTMTVEYEKIIGTAVIQVRNVGTVNPMDTETFSNRKGKGRMQATISYDLASTHPLVIAAIGGADLQSTLLQGLMKPREAAVEYDKEAKSAYSLVKDGATRWYIRDVLCVSKVVRVHGEYEFSASLPLNGVKDAIKGQLLLTGKYRQFILTDGQFESINIEGQAIMVDGVDETFYFALPEDVKEAIRESVSE